MPNNAKVTVLGNLIKEPERTSVNGNTVVSFSIAVSTTLKKRNGEDGFEPNFYNVSIWGKPAEYLFPKLQKGTQVLATGDLVAQPYTNKNTGAAGQSLNVKAYSVEALNRIKTATRNGQGAANDQSAAAQTGQSDEDELVF